MATQLSFLDDKERSHDDQIQSRSEAISKIAWSYSRRGLMEQCPRRYYYSYFGANKRLAKDDTKKDLLHTLKSLQNRYERAGQILHLVIGTYLRKSQGGKTWNSDRLISWAKDMFDKDITFSQSFPNVTVVSDQQFPPTLLSEFYYKDPKAVELCQQSKERLLRALDAFLNNPMLLAYKAGGVQFDAIVEKPFKLRDNMPCRIEGRIDLAFAVNDTMTIVDWKMGEEDNAGDDSLQLAVYAIWAKEDRGYTTNSIRVCKIFLGSGKIVEFVCNEEILSIARLRIIQDAERMLLLQKYGQESNSLAFSPCAKPAVCKLCPYLEVCDEGRNSFYA